MTVDYADRRVATLHEEDVINDRSYCRVCGYIEDCEPTDTVLEYHGDSFPCQHDGGTRGGICDQCGTEV